MPIDDPDYTLAAYTKISEQIIKEDNIVHQRVTAGLAINGFLATFVGAGYSITKDNLQNLVDIIISGGLLMGLSLVAIYVSYRTIRGIDAARAQIAYIRGVYVLHWKTKVEDILKLPRPFGSTGETKDEDLSKLIGAGPANLFRAIIVIWSAALILLIGVTTRWLYH